MFVILTNVCLPELDSSHTHSSQDLCQSINLPWKFLSFGLISGLLLRLFHLRSDLKAYISRSVSVSMPRANCIPFWQLGSKLISGDQAGRPEDAQMMLLWAGLWLALRPKSRFFSESRCVKHSTVCWLHIAGLALALRREYNNKARGQEKWLSEVWHLLCNSETRNAACEDLLTKLVGTISPECCCT